MVSTVTDKGQVTLPKSILDRWGIQPGTKLEFELESDDTLRVRVLTRGSNGLYGLLAKPGEDPRSLDEMEAAVDSAVRERSRPRR